MFLDIKIIRKVYRLITYIFRKIAFSGVITNFNSFLLVTYKIGLVYILLHGCEKFYKKIVLLKDIFKRNEYLKAFINKCITNFLNRLFVSKKILHTAEKKQVLIVLPDIGGPLCFEIRSQLQKCLKSYILYWLSLLHNFILGSLNSGSGQVQILLAACRRFAMVRISDNGPDWK